MNTTFPVQVSDEPKVKERPILFSAPIVRALLDGSKTQTRRIVQPHRADDAFVLLDHGDGWWPYRSEDGESANVDNMEYAFNCPYGKPGDRLWVRETWKAHTTFDHLPPRDIPETHVWYLADDGYKAESRTRVSMHMPRWASRILLEIVSVRVERLNDCSATDAVAEGIRRLGPGFERWHPDPADVDHTGSTQDPVLAYRGLWESINGAGSWAANPWVWVVKFKQVAT
jgi:hypothetical protein